MEAAINFSKLQWGEELQFSNSRGLSKTPHFIGGRYPCRSVAFVPRIIFTSKAKTNPQLSVLDPFMGSGTTAIEATKFAQKVFGVEVDPYARLIATVGARKYTGKDIKKIGILFEEVMKQVANQKLKNELRPSLKNVEYWFDKENFEELLRLKGAIFTVAEEGKYRDFFLAVFSDIIRAASKAERQSLKPYISRKYIKIPKPAILEFNRIAPKYMRAVEGTERNLTSGITWVGRDATQFVVGEPVDLAITSPPYINAMDYTRCIKLESAWVGTGNDEVIRKVKNAQLGESTRRHRNASDGTALRLSWSHFGKLAKIDRARFDTAVAFFDDMARNLKCVFDALKSDGSYFIIIGNSRLRGVEVPTHRVLAELAKSIGYQWFGYFKYPIKDHRTSIPRGDRGGKIECEHVLELKKP